MNNIFNEKKQKQSSIVIPKSSVARFDKVSAASISVAMQRNFEHQILSSLFVIAKMLSRITNDIIKINYQTIDIDNESQITQIANITTILAIIHFIYLLILKQTNKQINERNPPTFTTCATDFIYESM